MPKGVTWERHIQVESAWPRELPQIERGGHRGKRSVCLSLDGMSTWSTDWVPEASRSSKETVFPKFKIPLTKDLKNRTIFVKRKRKERKERKNYNAVEHTQAETSDCEMKGQSKTLTSLSLNLIRR